MTPTSGTVDSADTTFTNNFSSEVTKEFDMDASFTETFSQENTISTGFSTSASFSIEEGVEGIAKATESFSIEAHVDASSTKA